MALVAILNIYIKNFDKSIIVSLSFNYKWMATRAIPAFLLTSL
jgi:hypothetical protein